jgi:glutamate transport system substrate-binding protein
MRITRISAMAGALALALTAAACGGDDSGSGSDSKASGIVGKAAAGKLVVGVKADQPGLGLQTGGSYTGFDIEIAKILAKGLGVPESGIEYKTTVSSNREPFIQQGQVDLVVATYTINDERKKVVNFGGPYFIAGQDLLVKNDNTDITGPETLNGKKLCSVTGSTSAQKIKDKFATGVQLQEFDTYSKCVQALNSGSIDAVTTDNVILAGFAAQKQYQGKLKVVGKPFSEERYGVGIKQGDTALCESVNKAIQKMVDDGAWQKALDDTVGASGFKPDTATNPPKPDACS